GRSRASRLCKRSRSWPSSRAKVRASSPRPSTRPSPMPRTTTSCAPRRCASRKRSPARPRPSSVFNPRLAVRPVRSSSAVATSKSLCPTNNMGQKTNPIGLRVAVNKDWRSKWYADKKEFSKLLTEDREIRTLLKKKLELASVPKILIERATNRCRVTILTARPGVVIGRKGSEIDKLKEELSKKTGKEVYVDIVEVKQPELDAQLVAEGIALQLERRVSFRRAMKKALQTAKDFGAEGIKVRAAGRLGGAEP